MTTKADEIISIVHNIDTLETKKKEIDTQIADLRTRLDSMISIPSFSGSADERRLVAENGIDRRRFQ